MSEFGYEPEGQTERILSDDAKRELALQSVRALCMSIDVALEIFPAQFSALNIDDDLRFVRKILGRAAAAG